MIEVSPCKWREFMVLTRNTPGNLSYQHDDVIKWKHFPRKWPFVWGIHRSPVNSPHKGQWRGDLMFPLICVLINGWENNREAGDLRRCRAHWLLVLPCCQQLWRWLYRETRSLSTTTMNVNYLRHPIVEKLQMMQICVCVSLNIRCDNG